MRLFGFEIKRPAEEQEPVSFAPPQEDDGAVIVAAGGVYGTYVDLEGSAKTEAELVTRYRDMVNQPEVDQAVDDIVNEAIVTETEEIVKINLDKIQLDDRIKKAIDEEFQNIIETASENYSDLALMFDIEIENPYMLEFISQQAKEVLILRNLNQIKETESLQKAAIKLESKTAELEELNRRDGLTKLFNRRHFDNSLKFDATNNLCPNKLTSRWGELQSCNQRALFFFRLTFPCFNHFLHWLLVNVVTLSNLTQQK